MSPHDGPDAATPAEPLDRSLDPVAAAVRAHLDELGVEAELMACDPALADTAQFCEAYGFSLDDSANTIVVTAKSDPPRHVACVALATTRLDVNGLIRRRLEARKASFAGAGDTVELTGMEIGGVTPFGLPAGLPLWIDAAVMDAADRDRRWRQPILEGAGRTRAAPGSWR